MKQSSSKNISMLKAILITIPLTMKAAPVLFILDSIVSILHGISFVLITIYTQDFLDKATLYAENKITLKVALCSLIFLGIAYFSNKILNSLFAFIYRMQGRKVQGKLNYDFNNKVSKLPPILFEDTSFLDDEKKAYEGMNNAVWFSLTFLLTFTFYTPYFVFLASYLYKKQPILVYSILFAFLPMLLTQVLRSKLFMNLIDQTIPIKRRFEYYNDCMTSREYFKETRMLGAWQYFNHNLKETMSLMNQLRWSAFSKANLFELAMKFLTGLSYSGILYLLFYYVIQGKISIGVFVAVFASIERLYGLMQELVCDHVTYLTSDLGGITSYLKFMKLPERINTECQLVQGSEIHFNKVSFRYPYSKEVAIKNVSFHIKEKETVAIVGENGAGKSTLIRLLTGLYEPTEGNISIGSKNTKMISENNFVNQISGVFQKYQKYQLSLRDNITISEPDTKVDEIKLDKAANKSSLNITETIFDKGYDTILSREFDGMELSGGWWQRIAIARGYYKNHDIIVLDEPTAAIDPLEETRIYQQFAEIFKDKTAILITHRLSSAAIADRILVMKKGTLVECGTHKELIERKGEYARLYHSQEQWYSC
jgi:ATP-binding cassette, subfamily B, bacterial